MIEMTTKKIGLRVAVVLLVVAAVLVVLAVMCGGEGEVSGEKTLNGIKRSEVA